MKTGRLDEVFTADEQEYLNELADQALNEGATTLQQLEDNRDWSTVDDLEKNAGMVHRQRDKNRFFQELFDATEVTHND